MSLRPLGDLAEHVRDSTTPTPEDSRRYVGLEHLISGDPSLVEWASAASARSSKFVFRSGDILYGKLRPYLDKAALAEFDGVASTDILVLRPRDDVDAHFLAFTMHSKPVLEYAIATTAGVNHPRTSWSALKELEVYSPPLVEQRRIARMLSTIQRACGVRSREREAATALKTSLLRVLFERGPNGDLDVVEADYGRAPRLWPVLSLDELASVQTGVAKGRKISSDLAVSVPYLRVANVQDGWIDLAEVKTITLAQHEVNRYLLRPGDVVVTEGGDEDKLGRGFLWTGQLEHCVHQNHIFAVRPDATRLNPEYLSYFIQTPFAKSYFLNVAHRTTNLACINSTKLKALPVPLPTLGEQGQIVAALSGVDKLLASVETSYRALRDLQASASSSLLEPKIE